MAKVKGKAKLATCTSRDGTYIEGWIGQDHIGLGLSFYSCFLPPTRDEGFRKQTYTYIWLSPEDARKVAKRLKRWAKEMEARDEVDG